MDSSFFRVTKLAAWGERYFSCLGERVEASHPILSTSEVLHDAGAPYKVTRREE